mgnify:CR=1 FL=1
MKLNYLFALILSTLLLSCGGSSNKDNSNKKSDAESTKPTYAWSMYLGEWVDSTGDVWLDFLSDEEPMMVAAYADGTSITTEYVFVSASFGVIYMDAGTIMNLSPNGTLYICDSDLNREWELVQLRKK